MRLLRDRNLALVGTVSLLGALGVAFVPSVAALLRPFAGLAGEATVVLFGTVAGLLGLWSFKQGVGDPAESDLWTPDKSPERAYYDEHRAAGADVDAVLNAEELQSSPRSDARQRIRETATSVLASVENCSEDEAHEMLGDGSWTDDARAAAFFADTRATSVPLRTRIRDWASGETFERQARHAIAELDRLATDGVESHRRPQHSGLFADDGDPSPETDDELAPSDDDSTPNEDVSTDPVESSEHESVETAGDEPPLTPEMRAVQSKDGRRSSEDAQNERVTQTAPLADDLEGSQ